jgi:hypothetical protein
MEVDFQLQATAALTLVKECPEPTEQGAGWITGSLHFVPAQNKLLPLAGIEHHPTASYFPDSTALSFKLSTDIDMI